MAAWWLGVEHVLGVTNEQLAGCRPSDVVVAEFLPLIDRVYYAYIHHRWDNRANGWLGSENKKRMMRLGIVIKITKAA